MNRQITLEPTKEIAIGIKMMALATVSKLLRSASTAISRPRHDGEAGAQKQPDEVVAERLQHRAVGEDGGVVA